jgi:ribosomal protein L10
MSKYVKELLARDIAQRLEGVEEALLVNVIGLDANQSVGLRRELREKDIDLLVVKNSMARRASEGTPLARAFQGMEGSLAVVWGGEDFVSLAKEVTRLDKSGDYEQFEARGGVMGGDQLTAERVREISTWPNRQEQLSILSGQLLAPGGKLSAQLLGPGGALASQIEQRAEDQGEQGEASGESEEGSSD